MKFGIRRCGLLLLSAAIALSGCNQDASKQGDGKAAQGDGKGGGGGDNKKGGGGPDRPGGRVSGRHVARCGAGCRPPSGDGASAAWNGGRFLPARDRCGPVALRPFGAGGAVGHPRPCHRRVGRGRPVDKTSPWAGRRSCTGVSGGQLPGRSGRFVTPSGTVSRRPTSPVQFRPSVRGPRSASPSRQARLGQGRPSPSTPRWPYRHRSQATPSRPRRSR